MNEKGSVLVSVLLLAGLLILLAVPVLQVANAGYKTSVNEQVRTQAFYLAEAGKEHGKVAALTTLRELAIQPSWDPKGLIGSVPFVVVAPTPPLDTGTYEAKAWLSYLGGNEYEVLIKAIGIASSMSRLAQRVSVCFPVTIMPGHAGDVILDMVLFSNGGFEVTGSSRIEGDVGSNTTAHHSIQITGTSTIAGNLTVGPEGNPENIIKLPNWRTLSSAVEGEVGTLSTLREYPPVKMPEVPTDLPPKAALHAAWNPAPPYHIYEDGFYPKIVVNSELYVHVGSGERRLRVGKLDISGSGRLFIEGTGKLLLYVDEAISITGSGSLNVNRSHDHVFVYYYGDKDFSLTGSGAFHGSIQARTANVSIAGSGSMSGHVITGGRSVDVTGSGSASVSLIYAPNAVVKIAGSGSVDGAIVSENCSITGSGRIRYDAGVIGTYEQVVGDSNATVIPRPSIVWSPR